MTKAEKKHQKAEKSLRQDIAERFRKLVDGEPVFNLPTLAQTVTRDLVKDPKFREKFIQTMTYTIVAGICRDVVGQMRGGSVGDIHFTAEALKKPTDVKVSIFATHYEHDGEEYHLLVNLTKATGQQVINYRKKAIEIEQRRIVLIQRLIQPLKGRQTIGSKWTLQDIERIWDDLNSKPGAKIA